MGKIALKSVASAAVLALALVLQSSAVFAAGLGRLSVFSSLGEPLKAEIEILSLQPSEIDSLTARLASTQAYRQANIDLNGALLGVKFAIERRSSGQYVVSLTSSQPMNEPFIDMLVELGWNTGRLVREYTFLLDPPEYRGPAVVSVPAIEPPGVVVQPFSAVSPPQQAPTPGPAPAPAKPAPAPAAKPAAQAPAQPVKEPAKPAGSYTVKRGDTLAKIAQQNRADGVSLQQMLVALYKGNPDAFDGENMNRLRAGRILNLPDRETAAAIAENDARRMVNAQSGDYAKYRSRLGAAVAAAPAREDAGRQAAGRVSAPEREKPAAKEAAKDQLRLSRPEDGKAAGKAGAAASKDDQVAKDKALKEANERIALLEKNIAAMKSQAGAQLQQQAAKADAAKADAAKAAPKPEAVKPEPVKPEAAKADAMKADAGKAAAAKTVDDAQPAAPAPEAAKAPDAPKPAPKPVAPPPPPPPPASFLDELLEDPMQMGLIGLVVVLLGGYAFYAVRRKRKAAASSAVPIAEPTFASSVLAAPVEASAETGAAPEGGSASAFMDTVAIAAAPAESEEIDAVAEADVYMAYGRDTQAEEILKDALTKTPDRHAIRLKLLEIYAHRKDAASFEATARDLQAATGGTGADWEKAAALGLSIDPGNALYGGSGAASPDDTIVMAADQGTTATPDIALDAGAGQASAAAAPDIDFDLDLGAAPASGEGAAPEAAAPAGEAQAASIDFDLDLGATPAAAVPAPEAPASGSIDFDLDLGSSTPAAAPAVETPPAAAPAEQADSISIDFELPGSTPAQAPEAAVEAPAAPAVEVLAPAAEDGPLSIDFDISLPDEPKAAEAAPALDLSSISLDLGSPEAGTGDSQSAQWQEVATKLDLAKAYQDMGDKDGARELLNEVLKEGDQQQQDQARTMLEALG